MSMKQLIQKAARFLERTPADAKDRNFKDLLRSAETFVRKNPAAVIAGAVFAGLVVSRFVRSLRSTHFKRENSDQANPSYGIEAGGDYRVATGPCYDDQSTRQTYEEPELIKP